MSFLGLFQFRAPYLPWVLLGFSLLLGNSPSIDLMGIVVGHVYYYCEDVFPYTPAFSNLNPNPTPNPNPRQAWDGAEAGRNWWGMETYLLPVCVRE